MPPSSSDNLVSFGKLIEKRQHVFARYIPLLPPLLLAFLMPFILLQLFLDLDPLSVYGMEARPHQGRCAMHTHVAGLLPGSDPRPA